VRPVELGGRNDGGRTGGGTINLDTEPARPVGLDGDVGRTDAGVGLDFLYAGVGDGDSTGAVFDLLGALVLGAVGEAGGVGDACVDFGQGERHVKAGPAGGACVGGASLSGRADG